MKSSSSSSSIFMVTVFFFSLVLVATAAAGGVSIGSKSTATGIASAAAISIYDRLRLQGLPVGLLPKGISKYQIDSESGQFQVFLPQPCDAKFENQVHYDSNISGTLDYGRIAQLTGVSAQELFLWFPVKGIRVDVPSSGLIHFDVGVVDKQFSLSLFESPPDCTAPSNQLHSETDNGGKGALKADS